MEWLHSCGSKCPHKKKCPDSKGSPSRLDPHKTSTHTYARTHTLSVWLSVLEMVADFWLFPLWKLFQVFFSRLSSFPFLPLSVFIRSISILKESCDANIDLYKLFTARFSVAFFSSVYLTSCPILPCLANVRFSFLSFLWKPHPPVIYPKQIPAPASERRQVICIFRFCFVMQECVLFSVWGGWSRNSSLEMSLCPCFCVLSFLLAHLSGGMFLIWVLTAWGKMRSRCWIHMQRLSPLRDTQTHRTFYVEGWVGSKRFGGVTNFN